MYKKCRHILTIFFFGFIILSWPVGVYAADSDQQTAKREGDASSQRHDIIEGPHVEGHIAFLHAELGITPEQERLWTPVAAAMRQDVQTLEDAQERVEGQTHGQLSALQYLHNRVFFAQLRAEGEARFLSAFTPLYNNLSGHQKRMADELLIPHAPDDHS